MYLRFVGEKGPLVMVSLEGWEEESRREWSSTSISITSLGRARASTVVCARLHCVYMCVRVWGWDGKGVNR